jgi:hypothetical protein
MTDAPGWGTAIRDVLVRSGTQTGCGGLASALVDFEPSSSFSFVSQVDAEESSPARHSEDLASLCISHFENGIRAALAEASGGRLPPVRVVLRRILVHEIDSNARRNRDAGELAVAEALRRVAAHRHTPAP